MPGIAGVVTRAPREEAEHQVRRMVDAMTHERFYTAGMWSAPALGVYLGWVARKGSFAERMPICNEQGDVSLVFAGEDYPDPATTRRLRQRGHRVPPDGPCYLVHLYEEDAAFPNNLNGRFHGVVSDRKRGTATLFNDRYGMQRLYYSESREAFIFAAEAKAILAIRPELRTVDARSLGELVACNCVLEDRTLFNGIFLLPPAAAWTFRNGAVEKKRFYFQPSEWEDQPRLDSGRYCDELQDVLSRIVPRYFAGPERVAVALTGGLDTRLIMAFQEPAPHALPCYTFASAVRETEDVRVARLVAGACGQTHQPIPAGQEFLTEFARYAERSVYLTDGSVDAARAPDLYVSEKARGIAPAKVVGTYGSEVMTLVPTFRPTRPLPGLFSPEFSSHIDRASVTYLASRREHPLTFAAFRQAPWWHYGVLALEETQLSVRSPYLDNEFIRTVYRAPVANATSQDVRLRLVAERSPRLAAIRTDRGAGGSSSPLLAAAVRAALQFTWKAEYAYDYAMPQWLARIDRVALPLHLERLFLGRHKAFHFRVWYRDALSAYIREMLLDPRTLGRPYLQRQTVEAVVGAHIQGRRNYTNEIHKLLTLELVHRLFVDAT